MGSPSYCYKLMLRDAIRVDRVSYPEFLKEYDVSTCDSLDLPELEEIAKKCLEYHRDMFLFNMGVAVSNVMHDLMESCDMFNASLGAISYVQDLCKIYDEDDLENNKEC